MTQEKPEVTITHEDKGDHGRYLARVAGSSATGHLDWEGSGKDVRVATHTIVPPEIGGRGVAAALVDALVADAQEHGFRIAPQCSYVARKFAEHPEWAEIEA